MPFSTDSTTTTTVMARPVAHTHSQSQHVHKRRSSKDSDDDLLAMAASTPQHPSTHLPPRTRVVPPSGHSRSFSVANGQHHVLSRPKLQRPPGLPTLSPVGTSFHMPSSPNGHSHTRSLSTFNYSPVTPSPLSASFPVRNDAYSPLSSSSYRSTPRMQTSFSAPEIEGSSNSTGDAESISQPSRRSHNRMHSRNLSLFFPRPGSITTNSISELEDGTQEVSIPDPSPVDGESGQLTGSGESFAADPRTDRTRKPSTPLGQGFTFGTKPPSATLAMGYPTTNTTQPDQLEPPPSPLTVTRTRRGHHHKHSLSHNFFSFLEPGSIFISSTSPDAGSGDAAKQEPHTPVTSSSLNSGRSSQASYHNGHGHDSLPHDPRQLNTSPTLAKALSIINLSLGATLWVSGQQAGSLACTGLGYWVVFDAIGLALSRNFSFGLGSIVSRLGGTGNRNSMINDKDREMLRRPYGAARLSTLLIFAQSVYLMFSAVYVCKETIEHVLLSAGEVQGHHHHAGDETTGAGLQLPLLLTSIILFSLLGSSLFFDHNSEIVNITHSRIPSLPVLLRSFFSRSNSQGYHDTPLPHRSRLTRALSNPFVLSPVLFCIGILAMGHLVSNAHQRLMDLLLASLIAVITFNLAYRACVILGTVLLQTSPARTGVRKGGRKSGQMEAFLRAMRDVERHPHVLHLPAPHIWQIAPGSSNPRSSSPSSNHTSNFVVTLDIHVRPELGDEDVLELTRWAWERVVNALGGSPMRMSSSRRELKMEGKGKWMDERQEEGEEEEGGPEVTVGIVRG